MTDVRFSGREVRDFLSAWLALGIAFALFLDRGTAFAVFAAPTPRSVSAVVRLLLGSLLTVGVGFLLHELAHKVVAVRFGQIAEFRADYGMLALAVMAGLAGFLFAAPGAVYHRGAITPRENGLIALAGPVTNLVLVAVFLPLAAFPGFIGAVGALGVTINLLLAAFNMLPYGPLDGRKVYAWSKPVFVGIFVPSAVLAVAQLVGASII